MPSPLKGLMAPMASPVPIQVGPVHGPTARPMGRRPPVGAPQDVSGRMPHASHCGEETKASISLVVFTSFHWLKVESRPMPTFTRPSPTGKIQP